MPKTKVSEAADAPKKRRAPKRSVTRTLRPKKRSKSVLVDVIEDEPLAEPAWPLTPIMTEAPDVPAAERHETPAELDQQKRFYSELVSEIKTKNHGGRPAAETQRSKTTAPHRRVGLYRNLVIKFVILVLLLAGAVAYFSFSKLTVTLNLKGEALSNNLLLKVSGAGAAAASGTALTLASDPRENVAGTIRTIEPSVSHTYPATGETFLGDEISGRVRIINNHNRSQALVATTRLLSSDNKLFRLIEAVNVPAGGEVTASIYADKPSADMAIAPASFTIPGLWVGLQDKIYARSDAAFVFTKKVRKHVNASDLEFAAKDINDRLMQAAEAEIAAGPYDNWLYQALESPTVTIDAKIGEQKDQLIARASGRLVAVSFDREQAATLAQAKLNLIIPEGKELAEFRPEDIVYSLDNYDPLTGSATIKATFTGTMILKEDAAVIDPRQLVNLSAEQIATYLRDRPEIKEYELKFSPAFIKKAPSLVDRIRIEINKNQ